ncbi:AAA family ATPase [Streptomyces sp. NPDC094032]|uniref:helix-turn-helix transcriptional regulator n=1 Tax=Streptomyces sp. NPDC094032 TaxID=3155308 RepID=UPI00332B8214
MTNPYACTTPVRDGVPHPEGQLVGRGTETGRIADTLAAARTGRGGTVIVTGEPGVGKTRLAAEAITAARDAGMAAARGGAGTVGPAVPYRPLVEALLALSRAEPSPGPEEPGRYGPVLARLLSDPLGAEVAAVSPLMVAEAVLRLIADVGRRRGCLLVLDDLHEADPGTLAVVEYLLDNLGHLPAVLLLTTERGPCGALALAARARQDGVATVVDLNPLGHSAVRRLVAAELGIAPEEVSPALVRRAATGGAGLPFVVKELVHGLDGVAQNLRLRAARLGPRGEELLSLAALLGPRFPLPVLRHAAGCDEAELSALLRAGTAASLVVPDGPGADWYAFRYPLAAEALRGALGPVEHATLARRAADALTTLHPRLPGAWCGRAAELHEQAGDTPQAVRLYAEAARRATAEATPDRALDLLARAHRLSDPDTAPEPHAAVLERLLDAVGSSGRLDRLPAAAGGGLPDDGTGRPWEPGPTVPPALRAGLHARLAELQVQAGRPVAGLHQLDLARRLLAGRDADRADGTDRADRADWADGVVARVELAAALVEPVRLAPERLRTAEESARRAVETAHRAGLPEVAGRALLALARLVRDRDEPAAVARLEEARSLAEAYRLPGVRLSAELGLARVEARRDGGTAPLERARTEALRAGLLPTAHEAGLELAHDRVRRGAFDSAGELVHEGIAEAARLGLGRALSRWRLVDAVRWAHQGRRAEMGEALERLAPLLDAAPGVRPVAYGLARGFCALLEEDHEAVERDFARALAYDAENPATGEFGRHGVVLLLGVLAGRMGRRHHEGVVAASAAGARWNRPYVGLAHAVLLGREGRTGEATAAAAAALDAASPYPVTRHLCLRLVARPAHEDGWGAPVEWLREAEEFFHGAALPAPAGACRSLLRGMGAPVRQRRSGADRVPPGLRRCGITVREFEVARLLAERFGNRDIAGRLHISPRTVEKHVSSLLQKTGHPTRAAFASAARELVAGPAM